VTQQRHGEVVRAAILRAGLALWRDDPASVTLGRIGTRVGLSRQAVAYHYGGSAEAMRKAIAAHAVEAGDARVIAQLIVARHPAIEGMTDADRSAWMARGAG
jgi:AcrR family transcriptional regulator